MSIFGTKKQTSLEDIENLLKRVKPVTNINKTLTELQLNMNEQNEKYQQLKDGYDKLLFEHHLFSSKSDIITITAESKGALIKDEVLSLGNACKEMNVGYVMMHRGRIVGMGLSSKKQDGRIKVGIFINGEQLKDCDISLTTKSRKHINFNKPFEVDVSSVINFVCLIGNPTTECTVASLLIELY